MTFLSWWRTLLQIAGWNGRLGRHGRRQRAAKKPIRKRHWLFLELLEDRLTPTTATLNLALDPTTPGPTFSSGNTFKVDVNLTNGTNGTLDGDVNITYESAKLLVGTVVRSPSGPLTDANNTTNTTAFSFTSNTATAGQIHATYFDTNGVGSDTWSGTKTLFTITFTVQPGATNTIVNLVASATGGSTATTKIEDDSGIRYTLSPTVSNTAGDANDLSVTITSSSASTTTLTSSAATTTYGTVVTFTATVTPASPVPTGSVTFSDVFNGSTTTLGTGSLNASGVATYATTASQLKAGTHSVTAVYTGDTNYNPSTSTTITQTVNARALTITAAGVNRVYDGTTTATVTLTDDRVSGDTLTNSFTAATFINKNVGSGKTVSVSGISTSGTDASNYTFNTTGTTTANITARSLTVSATGVNRVYDGTTSATVTLTDDRVSGDTLTDSYTTATYANKNVSTGKTVSVSGISVSGSDAGNYSFNASTTTTASITQRSLTVSATGVNRVYDGTTSATLTLTDDRVSGDTLTDSYTTATFTNKNVGTGKTVSVSGISVSGSDAGNYSFNASTTTTASITQRSLTVSATGVNRVYDGTTSATLTLTDDRVSGDTLTDSYTTATFATKNVGTGKTVSVSGISISGTDAGNYSFNASTTTAATITQRSLTVSASGGGKTYDGSTSATVTLTDDRVAGDTLTDSYTTATFATKNVGTGKTVSVSGISISGTDAGNYSFNASTTTAATITQRSLTVSASGGGKTYDGTTSATVTLTDDRVGGDSLTDSYTTATFATKNVGTGKTVSVSGISISGTDAGNYSFNASTTTAATITQRSLTVSASGGGKTYDGTTSATVTLSDDRVGGDSLTDSYTTATFATKNVGTGKTVSVSGISISGTDAGNYSFNASTTTAANITQRVLSVSASGGGKTYDGTTSATVTLSDDRVGGDSLTDSYTTATFATKNVGTGKTVSVSGISISGTDAGNYSFNASATTTATITTRTLTVSATGINKPSDGNTSATVTLTDNRVAGDVLTDSYTTAVFDDQFTGSGKTVHVSGISVSGTDAGNYTFNTTATTTADITATGLTSTTTTLTSSAATTTYGTIVKFTATVTPSSPTPTGTVTFNDVYNGTTTSLGMGSLNGLGVATYTTTASQLKAGIHSVTAVYSGDTSYSPSTSTTITQTVNTRALIVTATGVNRVYDGTTSATVTLTDNRVAGDTLTDNYTATFANKNVANGKTVSVSGISLSGPDASNYTFNTTATTTANITKRALAVSAAGVNKVYDGTTSATVTLTDNRVAGDTLTDSYLTARFVNKNVGSGKTVTVSGVSISGTDAGNYTFNTTTTTTADITPRALTVSATGVNKVYNGTTSATVTLTDNRVAGDVFTDSYTATFDNKDVGNGKTVSVSGISLSGTDAGNYTFNSTTTTTANITKRALVVSATGVNKVYDGTTSATVNLTDNRVAGDTLTDNYTATFVNKNVANGKTVSVSGISLSGTDAGNYTFNTTATTTASITKRALTVSATGVNKVYNGTTNTTVTLTDDRVAGDTLTESYTTATFTDKNVGSGKTVSISGISVSGSDIGNYTFNTTATTTADITARALTVSATGIYKPADGTTSALVTLTDNRVAGDTLTDSYTTATFDDAFAGSGKTVHVSGISVSGADAGNYSFNTTATTTADITAAGTFNTTTTLTTTATAPTVFSQPVGFTATVAVVSPGSGTPTGTVTFSEGTSVLATGSVNGSGQAFFTSNTLSVGSHPITAVYAGDGTYLTSSSQIHIVTVGTKRSMTATVTSSSSSSFFGDAVTFTATIYAVAPATNVYTGTVTFKDGAVVLGTASINSSGVATLAPATVPTQVRTHTITAVYGGDANQNLVTSTVFLQTVSKATTSTSSVTSNINPSFFGQTVTFTTTVTITAGVGTLGGTVTFKEGTTTLTTGAVNATTGRATFTKSNLALGDHSITAVYGGNTNFAGSTSSLAYVQTVSTPTLSALVTVNSSDSNPAVATTTLHFTATVSVASGTPGGFVTFKDGATTLGTPQLVDASGHATLTTSTLAVGAHTIKALYSGDGCFIGSTSAGYPQNVTKYTTTTSLAFDNTATVAGQPITFTATVTSIGSPTGTVTFRDGATAFGTAALSGGSATLVSSTALRVAGNHTITAVYGGDATNNISTSNAIVQIVSKANTSVSMTSNVNPSYLGQVVTFTATVTVTSPGGTLGAPAGTVNFKEGTLTLASGAVNATTGKATFTKSNFTAGDHTITAVYAGGTAYNDSTAATNYVQSVTLGAATTTTVVGTTGFAAATSYPGQTILITATVVVTSNSTGVTSGTVTFKDGATVLGSAPVNGSGVATLSKALSTAIGTHTLSAVYGITTNYFGSTSGNYSQTVRKIDVNTDTAAGTAYTLVSGPNPAISGQAVTFIATITGIAGKTPTGTVTFRNSVTHVSLPSATGSPNPATVDVRGVAIYTITSPSATIEAVYSGSTVYAPSTSNIVIQTTGSPSNTSDTSIATNVNPAAPGWTVTLVATVSVASGTPTGFVSFFDGATWIANRFVRPDGKATYTSSTLSLRTHTIKAIYAGDGVFFMSTMTGFLQTVTKGTTTALTFDNTATIAGQAMTYTATVTSVTGAGTPTGTVTFRDGATAIGTAILSSGSATLVGNTALRVAGNHTITAVYGGSTSFTASTSPATVHVVSKANTTTSLTSAGTPTQFGQVVAFTATVTVGSPGNLGAPAGTVTFKEGTTTLGSGAVNATTGVATFTTSSLSAGNAHTVTAIYGGSTAYNASTSGTVVQTIKNTSATTITSSPASVSANTVKSFTVTVTGTSGTPTGTVTFLDGSTNVGTASLGSGTATFTYSFGMTGAHTLKALYSGDTFFGTSSTTFVLTVT